MGYQPLGIEGYGRDEQQALESFADMFSMTWDGYAMARDTQLTLDAQELKRKLRELADHRQIVMNAPSWPRTPTI